MSLITIFITPKGFDREHIALIQRNAIRSWKALGDDVDILLIGDDPGVEENAAALGVRYVKEVKRNASGTPMLDDIFRIAREKSDSPLLAYVNADIILKQDFVEISRRKRNSSWSGSAGIWMSGPNWISLPAGKRNLIRT